ncbi:2OG-Fe(II) oxygenase [Gluconacetobacter sp. Hr-1-5]|uniref:2OG-Fe(II) oxygenase n=1 Tax=Gluconacetobacter sp. Hr-1-5 TaxID=3395370 RepID=UPI003B51C2BF
MHDNLDVGDPVPWLSQICAHSGKSFCLEAAGGRFTLFCLLGNGHNNSEQLQRVADRISHVVDNRGVILFLVVPDNQPEPYLHFQARNPGMRVMLDGEGTVRCAFAPLSPLDETIWYVFNPNLRIIFRRAFVSFSDSMNVILDVSSYLPDLADYGSGNPVPVIVIDSVLEKTLCSTLRAAHDQGANMASPLMVEKNGIIDYLHMPDIKRRVDSELPPVLLRQVHDRVIRRVVPEIQKVFQSSIDHIDRAVLGCYDSRDRGHFGMHRDNTQKASHHRRYACSINLNDDYEGGYVGFPEYGNRVFRPGTGSAIIFSCSLLHLVTPVNAGRRYAVLLFLV